MDSVCAGAQWPRSSVAAIGRVGERSRFKMQASGNSAGARSSFFSFNSEKLSHEQLSDILAGDPLPEYEWKADESFPEIDASLLVKPLYTPLASGPFSREEDILILESRALLRGFQVSARLHDFLNCRVLMLVDNMTVCLSV